VTLAELSRDFSQHFRSLNVYCAVRARCLYIIDVNLSV
jgi:hypothetical protein